MAGRPISGKEGRVEVNGTILKLSYWRVTPKGARIVSTNFESVGTDGETYEEAVVGGGIRSATVEFRGMWDADQDPHNDPPNLVAGETLTNVFLYVRKTGNRRFRFPYLDITETPVTCELEGKVELSVSGAANGEFFYPT